MVQAEFNRLLEEGLSDKPVQQPAQALQGQQAQQPRDVQQPVQAQQGAPVQQPAHVQVAEQAVQPAGVQQLVQVRQPVQAKNAQPAGGAKQPAPVRPTLDDALKEGGTNGNYFKFMKQVLRNYFQSVSVDDQRAMFAASWLDRARLRPSRAAFNSSSDIAK